MQGKIWEHDKISDRFVKIETDKNGGDKYVRYTSKIRREIGVDMACWAKLLTDSPASEGTQGATTYGAAKRLPGLVNVAFAANSQTGTYFADNGPYAAGAQLGDLSLQVQCADLPSAVRADWYGQEYDETTGLLIETQINPIDMAFG